MKILVISDTHGYLGDAVEAIENEKCDFCIHLGDMVADCEELELIFPRQKFIFVKGNNDYFTKSSSFPDERTFELGGKRFFVCHGHKFHVKSDLSLLKKKAAETGAHIILFGHTHRAHLETEPVLVMNPGSRTSYGIIDIDNDGNITAEIRQ